MIRRSVRVAVRCGEECGRLQLAQCVVDQHWSLRRAAERFQVSVPTAVRWAERYREHGLDDDSVRGEELDGADPEGGCGLLRLVAEDFRVRQTRVVIDGWCR